jgi:predicted membrane protein
MMTIKSIVKIITAILLLVCLLKMPYGYFQFIRFYGMTVFIWLAYIDNQKSDKTLLIIWGVSILLINPFIKVVLGRTIWNIVDVIWAIILMATILVDKRETSD